jgi:hypothetical protein
MNAGSCCNRRCSRSATPSRRYLDAGGWAVSAAILALVPKCPLCLAMYMAVGLGVGISLPTATYLRFALILLCVASLAYFAARHLRESVNLRHRRDA